MLRPLRPSWDKGGRHRRIAVEGVSIFCTDLRFLLAGETGIHHDKDREHEQGRNGRPLQEKAEHDENEGGILGMPRPGEGDRAMLLRSHVRIGGILLHHAVGVEE